MQYANSHLGNNSQLGNQVLQLSWLERGAYATEVASSSLAQTNIYLQTATLINYCKLIIVDSTIPKGNNSKRKQFPEGNNRLRSSDGQSVRLLIGRPWVRLPPRSLQIHSIDTCIDYLQQMHYKHNSNQQNLSNINYIQQNLKHFQFSSSQHPSLSSTNSNTNNKTLIVFKQVDSTKNERDRVFVRVVKEVVSRSTASQHMGSNPIAPNYFKI